jgi:ornithine carbamoyltransferase
MGNEEEKGEREQAFESYRVTEELLKKTGKDSLVMHCLPAHRGEEITDAVMDSPQSIVFDQAENRLHVQKGILSLLLGEK